MPWTCASSSLGARSTTSGFARDLEARGRARATVARRLCTVAGFYRYAEQEGLLERSPAAHVRRPRLDYESHAIGLDRNEVGAPPEQRELRERSATASGNSASMDGARPPARAYVIGALGHPALSIGRARSARRTVVLPYRPRPDRGPRPDRDRHVPEGTAPPDFRPTGIRLPRAARLARWRDAQERPS